MAEAGKTLAKLHMQQNMTLQDHSLKKKQMKEVEDAQQSLIDEQVKVITRGHEEREVDCLQIENFDEKTITIMVGDTVHSVRDMQENETQMPLISEPEEMDFADEEAEIEPDPEDLAKTPKDQVRDVIRMETNRKQKKDIVTAPDKDV